MGSVAGETHKIVMGSAADLWETLYGQPESFFFPASKFHKRKSLVKTQTEVVPVPPPPSD
jgi:hypothetical protein